MLEYDFRRYSPKRKADVVELYRYLIEAAPEYRRRYFEWKYLENPFLQPPVMILAYLGDEVAAMRGIYGTPWWSVKEARTVIVPHADDLAVAPTHRNRGLFVPLMERLSEVARAEGHHYILGLSGGVTTQELALATGWLSLGDIGRHALTSRIGDLSRSSGMVRRVRLLARSARRAFARGVVGGGRTPSEAEIDALVDRVVRSHPSLRFRRNDGIEELADVASASQAPSAAAQMRAARDARYLTWRLGNPDRSYRLLFWNRGLSRGYFVLSWTTADVTDVAVAAHHSTDEAAFEGLVRALGSVRQLEVTAIRAHSDREEALLERQGFSPVLSTSLVARRMRFLIALTGGRSDERPSESGSTIPQEWDFDLLETMTV